MVFFSADSFWVSLRFLSSFFNCPNYFLYSFESECLQLWRPLVWKELRLGSISLSLVQEDNLLSRSEGRSSPSSTWAIWSFLYFSFWISFSLLVRGFSKMIGWTWGAVGSYSVVSYSNSLNSPSLSPYRSSPSLSRVCCSSSSTYFFCCFFFSFLSLFLVFYGVKFKVFGLLAISLFKRELFRRFFAPLS